MPTPLGRGRVTASTPIHSPSGIRSRWTVRSTLMKRKRRKSRAALIPLPTSAATRMRCSGVGSSPGDQRLAHPQPGGRRARLEEAAGDEAHLHRRVVAVLLLGREELGVGPLLRAAAAAGWRAAPRRAGRAWRCGSASRAPASAPRRRRRSARPRPSAPAGPGAATRASTRTGAIGTERRISKVTRPTWNSSASGSRSIAQPSSAAGGPACWAPGSQGPRVSSVARKRSPSRS